MNVSVFCIRHPVATILMSMALVVSGLFAYRFLPLAALPRAEFPIVSVSAQLPGASPQAMATSVATPLIKQFAAIAGIETISATSNQGNTWITLEFALERNIDAAAADVQSAIARAQNTLPSEMNTPPSYRKVNPADSPIMLLSLRSKTTKLSVLDAFSQQVIAPALSTIDGVAQVFSFGSQKYAVRVQIDPNLLVARGIGVDQLQSAIASANNNAPVGILQNKKQILTIEARTQLNDAESFAKIIIATRNGRPVRLGDVAKVIDSVENLQSASWYDGSPSMVLAVQRQPDANTVEVANKVRERVKAFSNQLPPNSVFTVFNDRSTSIRDAIEDVNFTLGLTVILVILVTFVFLRRVSATLIPSLAVPISIIVTLAIMYLLGFSIDNISLLGITLSVGLVVDDAIVMLENIYRRMEHYGESAWEASLKGSQEIGFTIVSISVSLVAVFIPVLLMGGVIGRLFNEFAIVVTTAILVSAFVSLTLTPMLCSRLLVVPDHSQPEKRGFFYMFEVFFDWLLRGYGAALRVCLRFKPVIFLVFIGTVVATVWLFTVVPKGFFPREDIGQIAVATEARQDISFDAMVKLQQQVQDILLKSPYVAHVAGGVGTIPSRPSALNQGRIFVDLKPLGKRPALPKVLADLRRDVAQVAGVTVYMNPVQNLNIGGRLSKSQYQFAMQSINQEELYSWSEKLGAAMQKDQLFRDVTSDLQNNAPQATLIIDRDKANTLGISSDVLRSTLYSGFGSRIASTIYTTGDSFPVIVEFDPNANWSPDRLDLIRIRSNTGALIPLASFARVERTSGPLSINQLGQITAVTLSFNLPTGVPLGSAISRIEQLKTQLRVPPTITTSFTGTAKTFQQALDSQGLLLFAAVITVYMILGILYESFIHPLTILSGLPSAAMGALAILWWMEIDLSIIAVIGLLMLIGIVKKNAIMMIDVALVLQREGRSAQDAIYQACLMRFRPIMMTTLAALMGALPIALGAGASAELRQPLGIAVSGGLIVSQVLTLFITPVLFLYMERVSDFFRWLLGKYAVTPETVVRPAE